MDIGRPEEGHDGGPRDPQASMTLEGAGYKP